MNKLSRLIVLLAFLLASEGIVPAAGQNLGRPTRTGSAPSSIFVPVMMQGFHRSGSAAGDR
jgi:hypothetical protein